MAKIKNNVEQRFDTESKHWTQNSKYNDIISWERYQRLKHTMRYLKQFKNKKIDILEIGCGAGHNMVHFCAQKKWIVTGADISQNMLNTCREFLEHNGYKKFTLLKKDIQKENINQKFDVIVLMGVVGYFKDNSAALSNINAMLKPKGILIFTYGNKHSIFRKIRDGISGFLDNSKLIRTLYNKLKMNSGSYSISANNFKCYTAKQIRGALKGLPLKLKHQKSIGFAAGLLGTFSVRCALVLEYLFTKKDPLKLGITIIQVYQKDAKK